MTQPPSLPPFNSDAVTQYLQAAKLKRLHPVWAKAEILLGLIVAILGIILLRDRMFHDAVSGALVVLGVYLAAAGHRSHLYQSMNRQQAYLMQVLATWKRDGSEVG